MHNTNHAVLTHCYFVSTRTWISKYLNKSCLTKINTANFQEYKPVESYDLTANGEEVSPADEYLAIRKQVC